MADKLRQERSKIAADEAKKAKPAYSNDLDQKTKELADLQDIVQQRVEGIVEAFSSMK